MGEKWYIYNGKVSLYVHTSNKIKVILISKVSPLSLIQGLVRMWFSNFKIFHIISLDSKIYMKEDSLVTQIWKIDYTIFDE